MSLRLASLHQSVKVKLVGVPFPVHLGHNVLIVVVPQGPAHLVVVHVGLALPLTPAPRHLVRVGELELARGSLPRDDARVRGVRQELQQELPQLDLARGLGRQRGGARHAAALGQHHVRV